ncbi:unnamed protein product [Rangifer tarandus platyrhynchus]|uniref:Uncharacterized protein n=1 Tax=Rangifer tarandus platyrhynchus TaxID=3082113 RepID=A0AC59Z692_RANTA
MTVLTPMRPPSSPAEAPRLTREATSALSAPARAGPDGCSSPRGGTFPGPALTRDLAPDLSTLESFKAPSDTSRPRQVG